MKWKFVVRLGFELGESSVDIEAEAVRSRRKLLTLILIVRSFRKTPFKVLEVKVLEASM